MADWERIGLALQGAGAGFQGQNTMPFVQAAKDLPDERKKAMVQDANTALQYIQAGDTNKAQQLLTNRVQQIERFGGDPSDTQEVLGWMQNGEWDKVAEDLGKTVQVAQQTGLLEGPERIGVTDNQVIEAGPGGYRARNIEGLVTPEPTEAERLQEEKRRLETERLRQEVNNYGREFQGEQQDRALRERDIELKERAEDRKRNELSATAEQHMIKAQDEVIAKSEAARSFDTLASDYERANIEGGVTASLDEVIKQIYGSQDAISEFRRRFQQVRLSEGLKYLPPGPSTDKDVELAMKGAPPGNAPAEQVTSFLRGAAKIARADAAYQQFKSDYIYNERKAGGLNQAWRSKVHSPKLKRDITVGEIYYTAQNRGISPEEVKQKLGIE